jgi:hypothetical protein
MKGFTVPLALLAATLLAGCGSSPDAAPAPAAAPAAGELSVIPPGSRGETVCARCHMEVYADHVCGRTVPCRFCGREIGAGHRHMLDWICVPCHRTYASSHVCLDARTCPTCRPSGPRRMPPRACDACGGVLTASSARPATIYCVECNQEAGPGHSHGKTVYCATCEREAGANHVHGATRMCSECGSEVAPDHQHGVTAFCAACGRDQGLDHKHGVTAWCVKCRAEIVEPHTVHHP